MAARGTPPTQMALQRNGGICNLKCVWVVGVDQGAGRERGATKGPREASDRRCWTTLELLGG